jgi:threonine aldolase
MSDVTPPPRQFASDNNAGIIPEVWQILTEVNGRGHCPAYGDDAWTAAAEAEFRRVFERDDLEVHFVFNGTASNSLALASICDSMQAVVCHESCHLRTDECNAPAFFRHGLTLLPVEGDHGKIGSDAVREAVASLIPVHAPDARALSLTQSTELGTIYKPSELQALTATARSLGLKVHMDGARFSNAVASLGCAPADLTWRAGIDVLSFGGTKNGMGAGEALVFFDRALANNFKRRMKQAGQLASKMRFLSAPWLGFLRDDVWLKHAGHANAVAQHLERLLSKLPGIRIAHPREANVVFAHLPRAAVEELWARGWRFYDDVDPGGAVRLMCAWDSTEEDVDRFVEDLAAWIAMAA